MKATVYKDRVFASFSKDPEIDTTADARWFIWFLARNFLGKTRQIRKHYGISISEH